MPSPIIKMMFLTLFFVLLWILFWVVECIPSFSTHFSETFWVRFHFSMIFKENVKFNIGTYYILKCDISKYFANINHDILKKKLSKRIKDKEALKDIKEDIKEFRSRKK